MTVAEGLGKLERRMGKGILSKEFSVVNLPKIGTGDSVNGTILCVCELSPDI